jgi:D-3-phosphoglycerate dehydrogenase / 2-oxoglutarate reductase
MDATGVTAPRVLVADALSDAGVAAMKAKGLHVDVRTGLARSDLLKAVADYDALIVRSGTHVDEAVFKAARRLRVVGRAGVGVDNIDEEAATRHGVLVMNTPLGNTISACEHTWALLLAVARHIPQAHASVASGAWDRKAFAGVELAGKTLGVVGLGRIGREVAQRAQAFQMKVVAYDPFLAADAARAIGVELLDIDTLLAQSDFVTLHTPLTDSTRHLVNAQRLKACKPGLRIINAARGGLIDEQALANALDEGRVAGAGLDVFETEPPGDSPLARHPHVVATPHLGASTKEAQDKVALMVAEQVAAYLADGKVTNATNLTAPPDPAIEPFVRLAEAMGSFAFQLAEGQPSVLTVECRGEVARHKAQPVAVSALVGILRHATDERINLVNAEQKAKGMGLQLVFSQSETSPDYASSCRVTLKTDRGTVGLLGTHLARLGGRVVEINGYDVEFKPTGRFLVVPHKDQPGTVAKISSILGGANINIAQMVVGRLAPRGQAISILRVDDPVGPKILETIRTTLSAPGVRLVEVGGGRDDSPE